MKFFEVAPLQIVRSTSNVFTYSYPTSLPIGQLVTISVGKKLLTGLVIKQVAKPNYTTKPISSLFDVPAIPSQLVNTALWMSEYYATHLATVLRMLLPNGIAKKRRERPKTAPLATRDRTHFLLNKKQLRAINTIKTMTPGSAILHGVTGSGKTAVYIELVRDTIERGLSSIILVPEIALTSQLVAEFQNHFGDIIVTHSRQTEAERHLAWLDALTSAVPRVVVGPRSALFVPVRQLGLIIIDEAHEPSFKQDKAPRYSALRVASILANEHSAKVIQGSATPLVSEYYLALHAKRPIISMDTKARSDSASSTIHVVDMTKKSSFTRHRFFSDTLLTELTATLKAGNQALIFHNRRGSATTTLCDSCGWSAICQRCFVPFTLHADLHQLRCHICGNQTPVPTSCPECHSTGVIHRGIGTKLIESELRKIFPGKVIARFDGDATNDNTVEKQYQELYDGNIDIIIGTQIIAKGLDLPKLRTVGVIQADAGLALPDYSASERTFQLLAQVIGRVGRSSHPTTVIVQSYQPNANAVKLGIAQNYTEFYPQIISERKRSKFPPYTHLLKLTCIFKTEAVAIRNAQALASLLTQKYTDVTILGPTPSFYERQHDTYRWQLVIKSHKRSRLVDILADVPTTHWQADLDPISLL